MTEKTTVRELRPADTLALFYSIDDEPGFGVALCAEETLPAAVHASMFGEAMPGPTKIGSEAWEQAREAIDLAAKLLEAGEVKFEDGWLRLTRGVAGVVEFLTGEVSSQCAEARYEDSRRYKEMQRADLYQGKYSELLKVVGDALEARNAPLSAAVVDGKAAVFVADRPRLGLRWAVDIFGDVARDRQERAARFVEEALGVGHREGLPIGTVKKIGARVYARPAGDLAKEIGQAALTLELLAENAGHSASAEAAREFDRVRAVPKEEWTRRHDAKAALGIANMTAAK